MPRNSAGVYTLPAGNPVVTNTVITPVWANPTMSDIAQELTNSLDRQGRGGMLAPFKFLDGTIAAPGITWINEPTSGWYRAGLSDFRFAVGGVDKITVTGAGVTINGPIASTGILSAGGFNATGAALPGNGMYLPAANQLGLATAGVQRLVVDAAGAIVINAPSAGSSLVVNQGGGGVIGVAVIGPLDNVLSYWSDGTKQAYMGLGAFAAGGFNFGTATGHPVTIWTGSAQRMVVDAAGNVGIGTSTPGSIVGGTRVFEVMSNGDTRIECHTTGQFAVYNLGAGAGATTTTAYFYIDSVGNRCIFGSGSDTPLVIYSFNQPRITVGTLGNVSIAVPAAGTALSVTGVYAGSIANFYSQTGIQAGYDVVIQRGGSAANAVNWGPNLHLLDSSGNTASNLVHGGGQTELWQFNGGTWGQVLKVDAVRTFNYVANGIAQEVGFRNIRWNDVGGNYSTIAADDGRGLRLVGGSGFTVTLAAGSLITIINENSVACNINTNGAILHWFTGAGIVSTSGNRSLAPGGVATCATYDGASWRIWGMGIS